MESVVCPDRLYFRPSSFPTVVNEVLAKRVVIVSHVELRTQKEYVAHHLCKRGIEVYFVDVPDRSPTRPTLEPLLEMIEKVRPETLICVGSINASFYCAAAISFAPGPDFIYVASDNQPIPTMLGIYRYMGKIIIDEKVCPNFVVLDSVITDISIDAIRATTSLAKSDSTVFGCFTGTVVEIAKELLGNIKPNCPAWRERATNLAGTLMVSRPNRDLIVRYVRAECK